jgi:starch synthase
VTGPSAAASRTSGPPAAVAGRAPRLAVLMVASEVAPWSKTGGLADVTGALPAALEDLGHSVTIVTPRYRGVRPPDGKREFRTIRVGSRTVDVVCQSAVISDRRRVVFVEHDPLFGREGYYGAGGVDYDDNAFRFAALSVAALDDAQAQGTTIDVVHAHDWQAGLTPTLLASYPGRWPAVEAAGRVFTIHNLAYQGLFPGDTVPALGLPWRVYEIDTGEFWGQFSFLKAGISFSDFVTTVSPTYARETLGEARGSGLHGVLAAKGWRYSGILNGIDTETWNPATDRWLPAHYDVHDLAGKRENKRALLDRLGLAVGDDALDRPLVGMVSRLVEQKGLDLVLAAEDRLMELDATWVFVGTGTPRYEKALRDLAVRVPARVGVSIGFDEGLAHLVEAGADLFLMPSRFEPCGLNQLYSLRYGTVPVVHAVGGLDDTVRPYTSRARRPNGFKFRQDTPDALVQTMRQAVRLYRDRDVWHRIIEQGMSEDHAWARSAREYVKVYRRARYDAASRGTR